MRWLRTAVAMLLAAAVVRLVGAVATTDTGWETIVDAWKSAALSPVGMQTPPLGERPPLQQARYWLTEVDRIVGAEPDDAALCMGAALALDSPDLGFISNHYQVNPPALAAVGLGGSLDLDAIATLSAEFSKACNARCLQLAERATQLAPDNIHWRRLRALLQFNSGSYFTGGADSPRDERWRAVLDECQAHDPDNALYDYLAAAQLLRESTRIPTAEEIAVWEDGDPIYTVVDEPTYAEAARVFASGQTKPYLASGEAGLAAVARFLEESAIGPTGQASVAASRVIGFRHSVLVADLLRRVGNDAYVAQKQGDDVYAVARYRQYIRLVEQAIAPQETTAQQILTWHPTIGAAPYMVLEEMVARDSPAISEQKLEALQQRQADIDAEAAAMANVLSAAATPTVSVDWYVLRALLLAIATQLSLWLFAATACCLVVAHIAGAADDAAPPRLGLLRHAAVAVMAFGGTFYVFGMTPAETLSETTRRNIVLAALLGGILFVCVRIGVRAQRRGDFYWRRFSVLSLLIVTTVVAILLGLWPFLLAAADIGQQWLSVAASLAGGDSARAANRVAATQINSFSLAAVHWFLCAGPWIAALTTWLGAAAWFWHRRRDARAPDGSHEGLGDSLRGVVRFAARTASGWATAWLIVFVLVVPFVIAAVEADYQAKMYYVRDPLALYHKNAAAAATAAGDPSQPTAQSAAESAAQAAATSD